MATDLQRLVVQLEANTENLRRELGRAEKRTDQTFKRMDKNLKSSDKMWSDFGSKVKMYLAPAAVIGFGAALGRLIQEAGALGDLAAQIGLTTEAMQELRYAAGEFGISAQGMDDSMRRAHRRLGEFVSSGGGPAAMAIRKLGLEQDILSGKITNGEQFLYAAMKAMAGLKTDAEKAAVAAQVFGDDFGPKLVPLLKQGAEGIDELRQKARDMGLVLSGEVSDAADALDRKFETYTQKWKTSFMGAAVGVGAFIDSFSAIEDQTIPTLEKSRDLAARVVDNYEELVKQGRATGREPIFKQALEDLQRYNAELERRGVTKRDTVVADVVVSGGDMPEWKIKKSEEARAKIAKEAEDAITAYKADQAQIRDNLTTAEIAKAKALGYETKASWMEHTKAVQGTVAQMRELGATTEQMNQYIDDMNASWKDPAVEAAIKKQTDAAQKAADAQQAWADSLNGAIQNAILNGENLIAVLKRMMLTAALFGQDGKGGLFGGILSTVSSSIGDIFTPGKAGGGAINGPTLVGERGPEIFVPNTTGRVLNNMNSRIATRGGQSVQQNITFTTDVQNSVRAEIMNMAPMIAGLVGRQMSKANAGRRG